jgi:nitric oxide synthase oxygenase domain/subunit
MARLGTFEEARRPLHLSPPVEIATSSLNKMANASEPKLEAPRKVQVEAAICPFKNTPKPGCPFLMRETKLILENKKVLADTGCTSKFCQAGRMTHDNETKLGESRTLEVLREEAIAFLWEFWKDGIYREQEYIRRIEEVLLELEEVVWVDGQRQLGITSTWTQTPEELLHGLRLSWKNSKRCIMRSHYKELRMYDLRHVTTSVEMVIAILEKLEEAYDGGKIQPAVFVFPARKARGTGPMFLNDQLLSFAGYQQPDGSILGDPANARLTDELIKLGWTPPKVPSKWDLLPIAAMADGDAPAMASVPAKLGELLNISHPEFADQFKKLDLKWGRFPALSRLGFDIGGVQYTAAPFIGW